MPVTTLIRPIVPGPRTAPPTTGSSWLRGAGWLALATVVVSALNYVFTLAMARVLPPGSFVNFAAVQALLLVVGTGVMSAVPWVVAKQVARVRTGDAEPGHGVREALHFGITASLVQGVPVALLAGVVGGHLGGWGLGMVAAWAGFALSLVAAPIGFLQGENRFGTIAVLRLGEALLRVAGGLTLAAVLTGSPVGALAGFPLGSGALAVVGLLLCRRGLPLRRPPPGAAGVLVRQALWVGAVQVALAALGAVDTVVAAAAGLSSADAYAYQLAALLGRIPLFLSVAVSQALFPTLSGARPDDVGRELRGAVTLYLRLALLVAAACWTVPVPLLALAAPDSTAAVAALLRVTVVTGLSVGLINVLTTAHQARGANASALRLLVPVAVAQPVVLLLVGPLGVGTFAFASAVLATALSAAVLAQSRGWWGPVGAPTPTRIAVVLGATALGVLAAYGGVAVWFLVMAALAALLGWPYLQRVLPPTGR